MPKIQITLTPAESKRLIAKAVAALPEVRSAMRSGTIVVGVGTTNACVAEELLGKRVDKSRFVAGVVLPKGTCVVQKEKRMREIIILNGKAANISMDEALERMGEGDVVIKGANALDSKGTAGVLLASRSGGTIGKVMGPVKSKGITLVIPVGLEKFIPGSVREISRAAGISKFSYATGCPTGLMPVSGRVVTELEAVKVLTGAKAAAMGKGGVSGAEGSVTLLVEGTSAQLSKAKRLIKMVKGEPQVRIETSCVDCGQPDCFRR
ncbi:MAG: hypothetical protein AB1305_05745 [Candidatus Hadarchaeota archaeon]